MRFEFSEESMSAIETLVSVESVLVFSGREFAEIRERKREATGLGGFVAEKVLIDKGETLTDGVDGKFCGERTTWTGPDKCGVGTLLLEDCWEGATRTEVEPSTWTEIEVEGCREGASRTEVGASTKIIEQIRLNVSSGFSLRISALGKLSLMNFFRRRI